MIITISKTPRYIQSLVVKVNSSGEVLKFTYPESVQNYLDNLNKQMSNTMYSLSQVNQALGQTEDIFNEE